MAEEATQGLQVNPDVPSAGKGGVSAAAESKIQGALDDAFGGVDDKDQDGGKDQDQATDNAGDDGDGEAVTTVREHKRRRRAPKDKPKPSQQRSQWAEPEGTEAGGEESVEDDDDDDEGTEGQAPPKPNASKPKAADPDDDGGGDSTTPYGGVDSRLVNAAKRRGWSEDRIQRLIKADEELAIDTFDQLLQDANNLSQEYATLGRHVQQSNGQVPPQQAGQADQQGQQPPQQQVPYGQGQQPIQPGQQPQANPSGQQQGGLLPKFSFQGEQTKGLDEGFVQIVLTPIQEHMDRIGQVLNNVVAGHDRFIQERQNEVLYQQIDSYFDGLGDGYQDLYGKGARSELNQQAMESRRRVVREADAIRYGAMAQGRNVSVAEALEMAHSLVSTPHRDQAARRKITNGLQQRQAQVTVRPTNKTGKNEQVSDDPIERAERNLAKRLKKLS